MKKLRQIKNFFILSLLKAGATSEDVNYATRMGAANMRRMFPVKSGEKKLKPRQREVDQPPLSAKEVAVEGEGPTQSACSGISTDGTHVYENRRPNGVCDRRKDVQKTKASKGRSDSCAKSYGLASTLEVLLAKDAIVCQASRLFVQRHEVDGNALWLQFPLKRHSQDAWQEYL